MKPTDEMNFLEEEDFDESDEEESFDDPDQEPEEDKESNDDFVEED